MFSGLNKNEEKKLAAIELLKRDDAERDRALADFAWLASKMMGVSGCFVTVFDEKYQYIKFTQAIPVQADKILAEESMCKHTVATCLPVICTDTRQDPRFSLHPLVIDGHILFYAAAPLTTKEGLALGALCVSEQAPLIPDDDKIEEFLRIAKLASTYLESWHSLGHIDPLTGLPNRSHLLREIERLAQENDSEERALILYDCIDIPRAYELSRSLGLSVIERMLRSFGPLLRLRLALEDKVTLYAFATGRYAVLVKKTEAMALIEKTQTLPSTRARITGNIEIQLDLFSGYVFFSPRGTPAQEVLRRAVSALHEAIRQPVTVKAFDVLLDQKRNNDFTLLYDLSEAIKADEQVYMVYQPKIAMQSGKTVGVEGLLRWKHPTLGHISPAVIVTLAEKTSLMTDITNWVVGAVLRQLQTWRRAGITIPVSVNFTASDLSCPGFADTLEDRVLQAGLTTADIRVECLETAEIVANDTARAELDILRLRGFKILLDDFGAGYSNINYLRRIPIDIIKLDRSLIRDITTDTGSLIIARNIITMLKDLDYIVLAEGIEDEETANILRDIGCDEAQGYYFSRPIPGEEIAHWLETRG